MTLALYIERDVEARLRSREPLPFERLTLEGLASHYGVSLTPVRTAIEQLVQREILAREPNGRLSVRADSCQKRGSVLEPTPPTNWDAILTEEVLRTSLRGEEVFLREESIAERLGMGRTQLRQVFHRLAGRGLLHHIPRRGWKVVPFHKDDMASYLDVREMLELKALDLARPHLLADDLNEMLSGNRPSDGGKTARLDNRLHQYFIDRSGNRYVQGFFDSYGGYYTALFDYAALGASVIEEMATQHRDILTHALAGHWAKARDSLSHHIRAQEPIAIKMLDLLAGTSPERTKPKARHSKKR